jgi:hypothetical protein
MYTFKFILGTLGTLGTHSFFQLVTLFQVDFRNLEQLEQGGAFLFQLLSQVGTGWNAIRSYGSWLYRVFQLFQAQTEESATRAGERIRERCNAAKNCQKTAKNGANPLEFRPSFRSFIARTTGPGAACTSDTFFVFKGMAGKKCTVIRPVTVAKPRAKNPKLSMQFAGLGECGSAGAGRAAIAAERLGESSATRAELRSDGLGRSRTVGGHRGDRCSAEFLNPGESTKKYSAGSHSR